MTDLILLMMSLEANFFRTHLENIDPRLRCQSANTLEDLKACVEEAHPKTRLISFCSAVIVPRRLLIRLNMNCYNFHPGPPENPGYRPALFAAHEGVEAYGVTLHKMQEKVDSGEICAVRRFKVSPPLSPEALECETYQQLITLAHEMLPLLARISEPLPTGDERWSGRYRTAKDLRLLTKRGLRATEASSAPNIEDAE